MLLGWFRRHFLMSNEARMAAEAEAAGNRSVTIARARMAAGLEPYTPKGRPRKPPKTGHLYGWAATTSTWNGRYFEVTHRI